MRILLGVVLAVVLTVAATVVALIVMEWRRTRGTKGH